LLRRIEAGPGGEKWHALGRASKSLRGGSVIEAGSLEIEILERLHDGTLTVRVNAAETVDAALDRHGRVPIPPYLGRDDDVSDVERYQTVYARHAGSVAAPTAGLHFTPELLQRLEARGIEIGALTLHVGLATFRPVTAANLDLHPMHSEAYEVSSGLARRIALARERGGKIVAIGTTVVRALESAADPERSGRVRPIGGETGLFIRPGHRFRVVDALLTNFHQPKSTLLALVSAFAGRERVLDAYRAAVALGYRFLSYGDAMWIPEPLEERR
jgi:S-adenosylmethionine:tRNA ribosyltransferase-isomerase